jgi:predicted nucleic acid-binding protein
VAANGAEMIIVDTDILVDVSRGNADAIAYLENLESTTEIAISVITEMELLIGCQNKWELQATEKFVNRFSVLPFDERISKTTIDLLKEYHLSHGLLMADGIIAATTISYQLPLVSKNQKDYRFIENLDLVSYP